MTSEEWAQTSISVFNSAGGIVESADMPGAGLEQQLDAAEVWLRETHLPRVVSGDGSTVRLFCSWSPAVGQRAMTLPETLVKALASVDGFVWLDFYPPDD
ncbi:hypothetical protein AB0P21_32280 [Kribbella sp. NPDC056861]|uniref:hypothetical protein n=1 Tax=Kribbella sp. NPDC056861 TaxID=3154857 RepID=UPI00341C9033